MWIKRIEDGALSYRFEDDGRQLAPDERDGGDVACHYPLDAVLAVEQGARRELPPLTPRNPSYAAAAAAFYGNW